MLVSAIARTVEYCIRHAHAVIAVALGIALAAGVYAARHFAINTGFDQLIPPELPWRQRNIAYEKAFPGSFDSTLIVVDAPSEEQVGAASAALAQRLASRHDVFRSVQDPGGGAFFAQEALLYLPAGHCCRVRRIR